MPTPILFPVAHWGVVPSPDFQGIHHLYRDNGLLNAVDSNKWTFSFHVQNPGSDAVWGMARADGFILCAFKVGTNLFAFFTMPNESLSSYEFTSSGVNLADGDWHHVLASAEGTNLKVFIDGVDRLNTSTTHNDALDFTLPQVVVAADNVDGDERLNGCLQEFYFEAGAFNDFGQQAVRETFNRGVLTAGSAQIFMKGGPTAFETNLGNGGAFTRSGPAFGNCAASINSV